MTPSILVDDVTKTYRLGASNDNMLRDALVGMFRRGTPARRDIIHALRGVSFDVQPGEVIGLIGRNGAGKSTLLKVLSRITYPTTGKVRVRGSVGSMLEVGTGFHDELTGRENIFLNGSILGMKRAETLACLDQIVEFADVGPFLDTPIKRYSSGMRMRLGFAVAAHLRTDVLFVDEVLAVGDAVFQKKCLGAMRDLGKGGRTVIFVSHNMAAIENLCRRTIWIAEGKVQRDGETREVIRAYLGSFGAAESQSLDLSEVQGRKGTGACRLTRMEFVRQGGGGETNLIHSGDSLQIRLHYECYRDIANLYFGVRLYSSMGVLLSDIHSWSTNQGIPLAKQGPGTIEVSIDQLNLMPGLYYLGVWAASDFGEFHDVLDNVAKLEVEPSDFYGTGRGVEARFGTIFFPFRWSQPAIPSVAEESRAPAIASRPDPVEPATAGSLP